ncbi:hypothetical protein EDB83DRAFT_2312565 [Lactarius deliciosus]|nr:hypothetical protein EDB83DRAFT_2312565 [Lactarius deliciosus]
MDANGVKFTYSSTLECPICKKVVQVGTAGYKNLEAHQASKACRQSCHERAGTRPKKPNQVLEAFFKPRAPLNPSTVSAPPPIHPGGAFTIPEYCALDCTEPLADPEAASRVIEPFELESSKEPPGQSQGQSTTGQLLAPLDAHHFPIRLLQGLEAAVNRIPSDMPSATPEHRLSVFAADPLTCVAEPGEDDWLIINQMMKSAFGWGEIEMAAVIPQLLNRGNYGLDGFIRFMTFFVCERGLEGALFETKVEALLKELDDRYPTASTQASSSSASAVENTNEHQDIIDVDAIEVPVAKKVASGKANGDGKGKPEKWPCEGVLLEFPEGSNPHMLYPIGIHGERAVPWNYRSDDDKFYLQAKSCQGSSSMEGGVCRSCQKITSSTLYAGIMSRIKYGAHENTPLIEQLRMSKLNDTRKLLVKASTLEDHKQWILAIASGRVDRVASLVQAGLKHQAGIKTLIQQYERAAEKLYKPKGFTNEDIMRSIVLLRLGGARVAEFAHQSLALPSLTTIRRQTVLPALLVSPSTPTTAEIEANILSCYSSLGSGSHSGTSRDCDLSWQPNKIMHQVIMLDELAVEKRVRWDDLHNKFQGTCREHNNRIPLDFTSEKELELLCEAIENDEVHLATEATVAAIGVLSSEPREYAVRPIMFSGTCKRETSEEHAKVIKTILEACNKQSKRNNTIFRTVCIASDGEAKRGDALVIQTMSAELSAESPIYAQLRPLEYLNLLVGPDDITADKDFKHIVKRQRNVFMRTKGVEILGFCITPSILRSHLESNGVSPPRLRSLLNPNDKQDVVLAYSLLKEIWSLPPPPENCNPAFALARQALNIYGEFARHLMLPYVCIDFSLEEQLVHLSAAAHLAFHLYRHNSASTRFMPAQSYLDIVLMIKNAFFCIAKAKVDNPTSKFYLISLGTDRLETFFGLVRTAIGTDANVDTLQLGSRASGLTEVVAILAEHPEWDYGTRRLSLPVFSKETRDFTSKADHINPRDWRGDVSVSNVNLHTCWLLGRKQATDLIPDMEAMFSTLSASHPSIDMLSPLGNLLVNRRNETEDQCEDDALDSARDSVSSNPYTHEGDLEDAIADEVPRNKGTSEITIKGEKMTKAKALRYRMAYQASRSSTDRLKRVQQLPCFDAVNRITDADIITTSDSLLGAPSLRIGNPVAVLVRCDALVVLAVAQVNRLKFASRDLDELPVHLLADPTATVDSQILRLVPATLDDDPTQIHDWCWSLNMEASCDNIPGQNVHPINPSVSVQNPGKPTFLFESTFLVTLSCTLFQELRTQDRKNLPVVKRSEHFPYRSSGQACFVCEASDETTDFDGQAGCSRCGSKLDWKNTQRVLEHMGAHILYDTRLNASEERCGLCLRPASLCRIYLKKGRGTGGKCTVDQSKSKCPNLVRFNYKNAARSSERSPCSNAPINCKLCEPGSPAVWTYSLHSHFRERHRLTPTHFPEHIELSQSEKDGMRRVWNARFNQRGSYHTKKRRNLGQNPPLSISEAHRSRLLVASTTTPTPDSDQGLQDSGAASEAFSSSEDGNSTQDSDCESDRSEGRQDGIDGNDSDRDSNNGWELYNSTGTAYPPSPIPPPSSTMMPDPTTAIVASPTITLADTSETPTPIPAQASVVPSATSTTAFASVTSATATPPPTATIPTAPASTQARTPEPTPNMDTAPPPVLFAGTSTSQGGPSGSALGGTVGTRQHRVRKVYVLQLNTCTCGITITDLEIQKGKNVMKCHAPGCETVWTCMGYGFTSRKWSCESCRAGTGRRRRA